MAAPGELAADVTSPALEAHTQQPNKWEQVRRKIGTTAAAIAFGLLGGGVGLAVAAEQPAETQIAGTPAQIETTTHDYNELSINGNLITLKVPNHGKQEVGGQPVGAHLNLDVDLNEFMDPTTGKVNTAKLTAYASLFSDRKQVENDVLGALLQHDLTELGLGMAAGVGLYGAYRGRRTWQQKHDALHPEAATISKAHNAPYRATQRRIAIATALTTLAGALPASEAYAPPAAALQASAIFNGTPLQGSELGGAFAPGVSYAYRSIANYITNDNKYYDREVVKLSDYLKKNPIELPTGKNIVTLGFVTDRHCNIGMDRVTIALLQHYGIRILISGGDDAFSGSFAFESGCTSDLAERAKKANETVVESPGNHDSSMTIRAMREQGIHVLENNTFSVGGLTFVGSPDPRSSRYGQGMLPASVEVQAKLLDAQAKRIGDIACKANKPMIVVVHDPAAGQLALRYSCGNTQLALDGHTHEESGPNVLPLAGGITGYQFTGASSGGAPNEAEATDANPLTHLTFGELNHNATVNLVSVDKTTGQLVGITVFTFTPDQKISVTQHLFQDTNDSLDGHPIPGALQPSTTAAPNR